MPKIDQSHIPPRVGTGYPPQYNTPCATREVRSLGDVGGLTQFGFNHVTLPPGCWSSQRHAHSAEDEAVYIISGHPTLIDANGKTPLAPGDVCTHPANDGNAHHLINTTDIDVTYIVVGTRRPDIDNVDYPDVDMKATSTGMFVRNFSRKNGEAF